MKRPTPAQLPPVPAEQRIPRPLTDSEKKKLGLAWKNKSEAAAAIASLATPPKERTRTSGVQSKDSNGWGR